MRLCDHFVASGHRVWFDLNRKVNMHLRVLLFLLLSLVLGARGFANSNANVCTVKPNQNNTADLLKVSCQAEFQKNKCDIYANSNPEMKLKFIDCNAPEAGEIRNGNLLECGKKVLTGAALGAAMGGAMAVPLVTPIIISASVGFAVGTGLVKAAECIGDIPAKKRMIEAFNSSIYPQFAGYCITDEMISDSFIKTASCSQIFQIVELKKSAYNKFIYEEYFSPQARAAGKKPPQEPLPNEKLALSVVEYFKIRYDCLTSVQKMEVLCLAAEFAAGGVTGGAAAGIAAKKLASYSASKELATKVISGTEAESGSLFKQISKSDLTSKAKEFDSSTFGYPDDVASFVKNERGYKMTGKIDKVPESASQMNESMIYSGRNNNGIEFLEKDGKSYFAKKITVDGPYKESELIKEARWTKELSDMNIGPKFQEVAKTGDGQYKIITEFIPGQELHLGYGVTNKQVIRPETIEKAKQIGLDLIEKGIKPGDLQFRVTNEGRLYVVDPAQFSVIKTPEEKAKAIKAVQFLYDATIKKYNKVSP